MANLRQPTLEDVLRTHTWLFGPLFPECYDEGYQAAQAGQETDTNPYNDGPTDEDIWAGYRAHDWMKGWWAGLDPRFIVEGQTAYGVTALFLHWKKLQDAADEAKEAYERAVEEQQNTGEWLQEVKK